MRWNSDKYCWGNTLFYGLANLYPSDFDHFNNDRFGGVVDSFRHVATVWSCLVFGGFLEAHLNYLKCYGDKTMKEVNPQFAHKPTVKLMGRTFAGGAALLAAEASHAAFDVSAAVSTLATDGTAAITAVGGAMISLAALAAVVRWAKAAFF